MKRTVEHHQELRLLSVVIPARDEEAAVGTTIEGVHEELRREHIAHEIIVVDDGSTDRTGELVGRLAERIAEVRLLRNTGPHGFGRAVVFGLDRMTGDAVVIMMADGSDDRRDVIRYWRELRGGYDCVFGSRFVKGGRAIGYPFVKLLLNRLANTFIRIIFGISLNDTTNAFKAYRREVIDGCRPLIAPHFNLTVEIPLKAVIRGFSWTAVPITWHSRTTGATKLRIKEMGSRYLFICLYLWLEKYFSRGDYRRTNEAVGRDGAS